MGRTIFLSLAVLCILVSKCRAQNLFTGGTLSGTDFYNECASKLGVTGQNREDIMCIQKCVFEKDGTLNDKGVLMKSKLIEYLFTTLFNNNNKQINSFHQCVSNLLPSGIVKGCWDIDKLVYCLVSNTDTSMGEQQNVSEMQVSPAAWMQIDPGQVIPAMTGKVPVNTMGQGIPPILMGSRIV